MNSQAFENQIASYLDGLLDDGLVAEFEEQVAEKHEFRIALDETLSIVDRLGKDRKAMLPFSMCDDVMEQLPAARFRKSLPELVLRILSTAACLLAVVCGGILYVVSISFGDNVYADAPAAVQQIEKAKTTTWKAKFYERRTKQDSEKTKEWTQRLRQQTREYAYKAPGLYRSVTRDANGDVVSIDISDSIGLKRLLLNPREKTAVLFELTEPMQPAAGPFGGALEHLRSKDLEWVGRREIGQSEANGFRHSFFLETNRERISYDFWIDKKTKHLVAHQVPGLDILDPDKVYEDLGSGSGRSGFLQYDIVFGAELDDSIFSLDVPDGYRSEVKQRTTVSEQEFIEFLAVVARYFGSQYPDSMPQFDSGAERERLAAVWAKTPDNRSEAETDLIAALDKYNRQLLLPGPGPTSTFIRWNVVEGTWKYVGKGVKSNDAERIVCWYQLKGSQSYRVVFGDLAVKDMAQDELPLPVGSQN